ncbi:MAG: carboxypeptidase regulatory-like domain-containing protein [Bacteroidales bacterium]|nr:carboxypeptidase regulatory-like domain-containing protein [Bacteroidales bacterium]
MKKILLFIVILSAAFSAFSCKQAPRPGEVHGSVLYHDHEIADIDVTLTSDSDSFSFTTKSSGYYYFRQIPVGDYTASLKYKGRELDFSIIDYEKAANPHLITVEDNGFHVRNFAISDKENLDGSGEEEEEEEENDSVLPEAELPILAWYSIPAAMASEERYQELKDCGFNISFSHTSTLAEAQQALEFGEQAGVKIMLTCAELNSNTAETISQVKDSPALYGYFLRDEPTNADLPALAEWADRVRAADSEHPIYFNLFPNYVDEGTLGGDYKEHVKEAIRTVKPNQVSFDFYPIRETGIVSTWWQNLEIIKECSEEADLPFWAFALSTSHQPYPIPEMSHLRLQMYTNLAYGAQCLQYFTYWCPTPGTWDFHDAPIEVDGTRTDTWDLVKAMNEELQARAGVFVGMKVTGVYQTGPTDSQPVGTYALTGNHEPLTRLNTNENGAVVSFFENGKWKYMMMVNRSYVAGFDYHMEFKKEIQLIDRDGTIENVGNSIDDYLDKGDCVIVRWK